MARRTARRRMRPLSRRALLGSALGLGASAAAASLLPRGLRAGGTAPRYLIVMGCFGGASMIDCLMPIDGSQARVDPRRGTVIGYDTTQVGNIRCVDRNIPRRFLEDHGQHSVVLGTQASSVNHFVAQNRSVTGRDVFRGRTLGEAVAAVHGQNLALPFVNMGRGGFSTPGADNQLDRRFRAEIVSNPVTFPLATSGHAGIMPVGDSPLSDPATRAEMLQLTRHLRDGTLEGASPFGQTFASSRARQDMIWARHQIEPAIETRDLITQLMFIPELGDILPLSEYGLAPSPLTERVLDALPDAFPENTSGIAEDRLQAQAALAYLLIASGASCSVTLAEPGRDGFLAWDQSHQDHISAQRYHWNHVLDTASRLIGLLAETEQMIDGVGTGTSLWDHSMILFATEFGRDKWNLGSGFGTGHHLNNGTLVVSPLLAGDQTLGAPDPNNGFICGFDRDTGAPTPFDDIEPGEDPLFSDPRLPPAEEEVYGTLAAALGVEYEGQQTIPVMLPG